uniref:Uncharacterized protein n=1 Tax=Pristionchus pacificus TaxID=54126 RepID=A0A8R1UUD0_PRIPA
MMEDNEKKENRRGNSCRDEEESKLLKPGVALRVASSQRLQCRRVVIVFCECFARSRSRTELASSLAKGSSIKSRFLIVGTAISQFEEERENCDHHRERLRYQDDDDFLLLRSYRENEFLAHNCKSPDGNTEIGLIKVTNKCKGRVIHLEYVSLVSNSNEQLLTFGR